MSHKCFLKVKLAGGAAAQCLALMNSLYLQNKLKREFKLYYYPHSTGTYWPFAIEFLIKPNELGSSEELIKGLNADDNFEVGKIIRSHPLSIKRFSYEKFLSLIRKLKLERVLQKLRGESALMASANNLEKVSWRTRAVSGGFVPYFNKLVNLEMNFRFVQAGKKSPFSLSLDQESRPDVVIHYRIGDKRASFGRVAEFGGDGICDPTEFKNLIENYTSVSKKKIVVISDEPLVAVKLLSDVGVEVELNEITGDIWEDIYIMSQARFLIGSWSQVSQLAALCVAANGGLAILPSTTQSGAKVNWKIPTVDFYTPKFLRKDHWIYSDDF